MATTSTDTSQKINSTTNTNTTSTVKGDNGFCILASLYNSSSDSYIQNYQALVFDSVTATQIKRQAQVTSYPVENASEVSDNVQVKNTTFSLSGVISETPIQLSKDLLYSTGINGTRISQAIVYLDQIFEARQTILLITEHKVYENVILTGYTFDYKAEYAMQFDLDFEQVRTVSSATTNAIAIKTQKSKNVGKKTKVVGPSSNLTQSAATITNTPTNSGSN